MGRKTLSVNDYKQKLAEAKSNIAGYETLLNLKNKEILKLETELRHSKNSIAYLNENYAHLRFMNQICQERNDSLVRIIEHVGSTFPEREYKNENEFKNQCMTTKASDE